MWIEERCITPRYCYIYDFMTIRTCIGLVWLDDGWMYGWTDEKL